MDELLEFNDFSRFVGQYVLMFQAIEALVDDCLLLLWEAPQDWAESQRRLGRLTNFEKVEAFDVAIRTSPHIGRFRARDDWDSGFERLVRELHAARTGRNGILHGHYLYDFLEAGMPIVRADRKVRADGGGFVDVTAAWSLAKLKRLVKLGAAVGRTKIQLVSDFGALRNS